MAGFSFTLPVSNNQSIFYLFVSANDEKQATLSDNYKVITFDIKVVADIALVAGKSTQQVAYTGKIKGEKAMIDMEDIGNEVEHRFAVSWNFCICIILLGFERSQTLK